MAGFGFKGRLYKLKIDAPRFLKEHERRANQVIREAAREWVLAAYDKVPVWTGMARGAFKYAQGRSGPSSGLFLSVYLKVLVPIGPQRTFDLKPLEVRSDKSPEQGGRESRYTFSNSEGQFRFTFNTSISYFEVNDQLPGDPPSYSRPWNAFQAGKSAFDNYIHRNAYLIIPKLKEYFIVSPIELSG